MVARTQVVLHSELHRRARGRAAELGISLAEYLRRLVAEDLGESRPPADVTLIFDLGASGGSDVAAQKDRYIAEAMRNASSKSRRRANR